MNCPFKKNHSRNLSKILSIAMAALMLSVVFTGCQKKEAPEPSAEPLTPPNLVETTVPTEPAPTEAPTEPEKKNVAVVKEQVNVRSSPSVESNVIGQLDAGDEVEVNRIEAVSGIQWAYIPLKGWVTVDNLDMSNVTGVVNNNATPANPLATEPPATTPPANNQNTTDNNTAGNNNNNTNSANTGNGQKGVVTANGLNVRKEANTNSEIVGTLNYGTRVTVQESNNGWGRTGMGWISLSYVYMDGSRGENTCTGVITGSQLNIRSGPGTNYEAVGAVNKGEKVTILEQIKVGKTTWGCTSAGWISMDYVDVDGETDTEETNITGTVTGNGVNVRSGPGTNYGVVGSLDYGDTVTITAQTTVGTTKWGKISNGWVCMDFIGVG